MKRKPHKLTPEELQLFARFIRFEVTRSELLATVRGVFTFDFTPAVRRSECNFAPPAPGVRVTLSDIDNATAFHAQGRISTDDLTQWATLLLHCDAYDWEGPEENEIAGRLNDLSMPQLFMKGAAEQ